MTPIHLFPDQIDLVDRVRAAMRHSKTILMQSATGSGKTVMSSYMIQLARAKGSRCLFSVPRRELLRQTAETFENFGIPFGYVSAGYTANPFAQVQLATSATLARRLDKAPKADVVFMDETHFGAGDIETIIAHYKQAGAWIVGLSATPLKMNGKGLGDWYQTMEEGPSLARLIELGRLSSYRLFAPSTPELSGIKTSGGEFSKAQLAERMEQDRVLIGNAVKHYSSHAMGRLNVAYCTSVKHAEIVAEAFRNGGVPAACIHGKMDDGERGKIVKAFARRELLVLTNVDLLCFGFDLSSAAQMDVTIECMSDLRPTKSLPLQLQKWGRVLRKKDFPAIIFDHAGNVTRHGMPDDDRQWSLAGRDAGGRDGHETTHPVKQCDIGGGGCGFVHRPAPACPNCGRVYPVQSRMVEEVDGVLAEITESPLRPTNIQGMAKGLDDLIRLGRQKGYKSPEIWAAKVMSGRVAKALRR